MDCSFLQEHGCLRYFSRRKRTPLGPSSSCQAVDSQPYGVSFDCRAYGRASANELPDPHFKIKEFAFRVAASSANLPLEEPLLWRALDMDGNPNSSVRPAPVEEPHTVFPLSRRQQQAKVWPPEERDRSFAAPPGGWLQDVCGRGQQVACPRLSDPLRSVSSRRPCGAEIPSTPHEPNKDNRSRQQLGLAGPDIAPACECRPYGPRSSR